MKKAGIAAMAVVALGLAASVTTGTASAAPGSDSPSFAAEGRTAGLTPTQISELQQEVDGYLATTGGRQVALNEVALTSGSTLLLAIPGETYARDLNSAAVSHAGCPYHYFCGWKGTNATGDQWDISVCGVLQEIPNGWDSGGSWENNQTPGLVASFYNKQKAWLSDTPPAHYGPVNGNWHPVWYVQACY
ncbi:hypothetical protein ACFZB9_07270 [Kitasatospora sp. NPDC008050]|uniref:hypothetical protein n=1 Tax=Kitasatospora sp. NPDC008050 TaxID=3364021 RepID=UPI0036E9C1FF